MKIIAELEDKNVVSSCDIIDFNKLLPEIQDKISIIRVIHSNKTFILDWKSRKLFADDKLILDANELKNASNCEFVNFRRHRISYNMQSRAKEETFHGLGWKGTVNGKVIENFILIDEKTGEFKVGING